MQNNKKLLVPVITIIGVIALLYFLIKLPANTADTALQLPGGQKVTTTEQAQQKLDAAKNQAQIPEQKLLPTDHTQGNINARIIIFEYSDLDCPFCVRFHPTMKQLVAAYPNDVLWVYRHFPLDELHPKARIESIASECVAQLGGNESFWKFLDNTLAFTSSSVDDPIPTLTGFAKNLGINEKDFINCQISNTGISELIQNQQNLAIKSGAQGTPFNIILDRKTGAMYPAPGAQPIESMQEIVKTILAE